jgi:hypothetical protein
MKSKPSFLLKSQIEKMLQAFWKKLRKTPKRKLRKRVNKTTDDWRENVMWLRDGLYQTDVPVPGLSLKIDLISRTEGIAYELKTAGSRKHLTYELADAVSKVEMFNRQSEFKIQMLVFITQELNVPRLEICGVAQMILQKAASADFGIELIGI